MVIIVELIITGIRFFFCLAGVLDNSLFQNVPYDGLRTYLLCTSEYYRSKGRGGFLSDFFNRLPKQCLKPRLILICQRFRPFRFLTASSCFCIRMSRCKDRKSTRL